ncbi:hypothetical protein LUZ60_010763 [Juncus effusus]|nr:hypothetical protein LUZ60_010763 [Juncus effusus]
MEAQLKDLFSRIHQQFGTGPGLGTGTGTCLLKVNDLSPSFIKSIYKALAAMYRTDPWKRVRPNNLFGFRVGKDSDLSAKRQLYPCAQFIGGDGGDLGIHLFKSEQDGLRVTGLMESKFVPNVEVLRVVFEKEALLFGVNKRMVCSLSLEGSGSEKYYPIVDVARCDSKGGGIRFRDPNLEELRYLYAFIKAITLVHPLLQIQENDKNEKSAKFEAFIETVDVDFPAELAGEIVAVTISYPPNQTYEEKQSISKFSNSNSSPIKYLEPPKEEEEFLGVRKCELCEKSIQIDQTLSCARCKSVIYCGPTCQKNHWKEAHKNLCALYKSMMDREEELILKIFKFNFVVENPCKWLESMGLHKKGIWRRICACFNHYPFGLLPINNNDNFEIWGGLDGREIPSNNTLYKTGNSNPGFLSSWSEYYNIRNLPLSSPVSVILSHPLTIYYILTTLVISTKNRLIKGKDVILHYLGPAVELDWLQTFCEMAHLLNGSGNLKIYMIGPEIPTNLIGLVPNLTNKLRINLVRGLYQDQFTNLPSPHLIIGLNCDLESCSSWNGVIGVIKGINVPAFFTEKSEILCGNAKRVLRKSGLNLSHPVGPNPFRSPLREKMGSNNLPCFSNGFIFGVNT